MANLLPGPACCGPPGQAQGWWGSGTWPPWLPLGSSLSRTEVVWDRGGTRGRLASGTRVGQFHALRHRSRVPRDRIGDMPEGRDCAPHTPLDRSTALDWLLPMVGCPDRERGSSARAAVLQFEFLSSCVSAGGPPSPTAVAVGGSVSTPLEGAGQEPHRLGPGPHLLDTSRHRIGPATARCSRVPPGRRRRFWEETAWKRHQQAGGHRSRLGQTT